MVIAFLQELFIHWQENYILLLWHLETLNANRRSFSSVYILYILLSNSKSGVCNCFLWIELIVQWKCYHILKSSSALKYTDVGAKLCSSMWWNYPSFYKNTCELGTCRWGQWSKVDGDLAMGVRVSCKAAAGGAATARASLVPGELPSSQVLLQGLARAAAPLHCCPVFPWLWAAGPDYPVLPTAWAGGSSMRLLPAKMTTACLVIMLRSQLPLLIPHKKCG